MTEINVHRELEIENQNKRIRGIQLENYSELQRIIENYMNRENGLIQEYRIGVQNRSIEQEYRI